MSFLCINFLILFFRINMNERLESRNEPNLSTSESARNWTESSKNSKLIPIANKLANYNWDDANELRSLIQNREYKKFQSKIWITWFRDLDWKLWPRTLKYLDNYIEKIENTKRATQKTDRELQNIKYQIRAPKQEVKDKKHEPVQQTPKKQVNKPKENDYKDYVHRPEYQQLTDSAKIHKNAKEYLSKHESLSEADYNRLFSWKEQLRQWQIWNCYLVSWFIELANTDYFDTLMRTSISRVRFKDDWSLWYNIRIPLWEPDGRDILIKDSELIMAKINWNTGFRLLEIAYVKNRRKNDKQWNKYSPVTEWEYQATRWWTTDEVLRTFLGRNNISFSILWDSTWAEWRTLDKFSPKRQQEIKGILKNFDPAAWDKFISLVTPPAPWWDSSAFNVWWHTIYNKHVYAVDSVQKYPDWDIAYVKIKNPRKDPSLPWGTDLDLTFDEFLKSFAYIWVWRIKADTFLDEKWISYA